MGPELIHPQQFGFKDGRPTRHSDCYALGMVVYEVLSGCFPFFQFADAAVFMGVIKGVRPERPQGAWFTNDVWGVLEQCWMPHPDSRPSIEDVLQCLEKVSRSWIPPSPQMAASEPTMDLPTCDSSDLESHDGTTDGMISTFFLSNKPIPEIVESSTER